MKTFFLFALGLFFVIPSFASSLKVQDSTKATRADNLYYAFAYDAVPQGNNVYSVTIYFLLVNQTNFTYTYVNAPQAITITGNFPGTSVTSFTFPAGAGSFNVGNFTYSTPPTQAIPISTNPSSVSGLPISDILADINIP
jgi:hypothetical protein